MRYRWFTRLVVGSAVLFVAFAPAFAQAPASPQAQPRTGQPEIPLFQAPNQPAQPRQQTQQQPRQQPQRQPPQTPPAQQQQQPAQQQPAQQQPAQQPPAQPAQTEPYELPPAGTMIVVVDVQQLLRESTAGGSIRTQADRQRVLLQQEVQQQENSIRAQQTTLAREQPNLSAEQFNQRRRAIEQRIGELERQVQEKRRQLDQSFGEAMNQFQRSMSDIIGEIVQEKQYLIVLNREAVVGFSTVLDITPEVMRRLNQRLPQVPVNLPGR